MEWYCGVVAAKGLSDSSMRVCNMKDIMLGPHSYLPDGHAASWAFFLQLQPLLATASSSIAAQGLPRKTMQAVMHLAQQHLDRLIAACGAGWQPGSAQSAVWLLQGASM
jgi:hypothetical protein